MQLNYVEYEYVNPFKDFNTMSRIHVHHPRITLLSKWTQPPLHPISNRAHTKKDLEVRYDLQEWAKMAAQY
jgi:hypothetical protein